jgi:hypothetical protein
LWDDKVQRLIPLEPVSHLISADPKIYPSDAMAICDFAKKLFAAFSELMTARS